MKSTKTNPITRASVTLLLRSNTGEPRRLSDIAETLGVAPRTLRRRLSLEGTSFTALKAEVLGEIAKDLLLSGAYSHDEIATRLGLSDGANFRQAFRRWTGVSTREAIDERKS